jgi:hypothetical protein
VALLVVLVQAVEAVLEQLQAVVQVQVRVLVLARLVALVRVLGWVLALVLVQVVRVVVLAVLELAQGLAVVLGLVLESAQVEAQGLALEWLAKQQVLLFQQSHNLQGSQFRHLLGELRFGFVRHKSAQPPCKR